MKFLALFFLLVLPLSALELETHPSDSPLISFRVFFRVGTVHESRGQEGLAALTAALLADGGTAELTYPRLVERLYPLASSVSAQVDKEATVFYGTTHQDNLEKYYRLLRQMLLDPGFRPEDFERLRTEQINRLKENLRANNDEELGKEVLYTELYRDHPYGSTNLGRLTSLENLTLKDVERFYLRHYRAGSLVVGLAGGYPTDFPERVERDFSSLLQSPAPSMDLPAPARPQGRRIKLVEKATRSTAISLGFPIEVNRSHPDWTALWLVRSFFGEHRSSNSYLYQRLRALRGLNYGDYAYIEYFPNGMFLTRPDPNYPRRQQIFQVWIRPVEPDKAHFALRATLYELEKLVKNGLTSAQFEATRDYLHKNVALLLDTEDRQLGYALDDRFYQTEPFLDRVRGDLAKLTVEDVNRVVKEQLRADDLQLVLVTPQAAKLRAAILEEVPSPITYNSPKPQEVVAEDQEIAVYPVRPSLVEIIPLEEVFQ